LLLGILGELSKLFKFVWLGDASTVAGKPRAKNIRHQCNVVLNTNWTLYICGIAKVFCSAHEVGVSITQLFSTDTTSSKFVNQCATREAMINDTANSFTIVISKRQLAEPTRRAPKRIHWGKR
jgi:hypothetical protein